MDDRDDYEKVASGDNRVQTATKESARARKWRTLKGKFEGATTNARNGFIAGSAIGGMFGFIVGVFSAFKTRRFVTIPLSMIASGGTFGMIVACGSLIRT